MRLEAMNETFTERYIQCTLTLYYPHRVQIYFLPIHGQSAELCIVEM